MEKSPVASTISLQTVIGSEPNSISWICGPILPENRSFARIVAGIDRDQEQALVIAAG